MLANAPTESFAPYERPVRAAFVGLGRIYDLNVRVLHRQSRGRSRCASGSEHGTPRPAPGGLAGSADLLLGRRTGGQRSEVDAVEVLLPIPLHADGVAELLGYGWHVNLQKPICNDLADATRWSKRPRPTAGCCG